MVNWTDPIIHWNQLGSAQLKRLIDTWGKDEAAIAKYDKKHGHAPSALKVPAPVARTATKTVPAKKAAPKKSAAAPVATKPKAHRCRR